MLPTGLVSLALDEPHATGVILRLIEGRGNMAPASVDAGRRLIPDFHNSWSITAREMASTGVDAMPNAADDANDRAAEGVAPRVAHQFATDMVLARGGGLAEVAGLGLEVRAGAHRSLGVRSIQSQPCGKWSSSLR